MIDFLGPDFRLAVLSGSLPNSVTIVLTSCSFASSLFVRAAISDFALYAALHFSDSCAMLIACSRMEMFSASRRDISASRFRIRSDCVELTLAISRFCRINLLFNASMDSTGGPTGGSFNRAI